MRNKMAVLSTVLGLAFFAVVALYAAGEKPGYPERIPAAVDAVADGTTKGIATYNPSDFTSDGSGRISLASITNPLSCAEADGTPTLASATSLIIDQTSGLDLASDGTSTVTISGTDAIADGTGKGVATFAAADFTSDGSGRIGIDYANGQEADGTLDGFMSVGAWAALQAKAPGADAHTGIVYYSDATATTYDTGTLVCVALGRTCVTTHEMTGTPQSCSYDFNPDGTAIEFYAACR